MSGSSVSESGDMANERSRRVGGWFRQSRHHSLSDEFAALPRIVISFIAKTALRHSESDVYFELRLLSTEAL